MNARTSASGACVAILTLLGVVGSVCAQTTYYVDSDGAADFRTIQAAVDAAVTGDIVVVQPGYYTGSGNWDVKISGKSITVRGFDPNNPATVEATVIDCADTVGHRAFEVAQNTGVHLTLAGLTMINGSTTYQGGAVLCRYGDLTAINCAFYDNEAEWRGGAVCCAYGSAVFEGCTFSNGNCNQILGGAFTAGDCAVSFTDCTFESNRGGTVVVFESGLTLVDCIFKNNVGTDGGAIYTYAGPDNVEAHLNMTRCVFMNNASNTYGGAFYSWDAHGTIDACTFVGNTASADGGAMYTRYSPLAVTNCVFGANLANQSGGAVANSFNSRPQFVNCTFVDNQAVKGGAMASGYDANPTISNSILWGNTATIGPSLFLAGINSGTGYTAKTTIRYSDIENGILGTHADPGCTLTWGAGNINADPLFTGQVIEDYHLSTDSPCVDTGDPTYVPSAGETDLDGQTRKYGAAVDMGAYEYQGLGPVYRFWSPTKRRHFYTISGAERDVVMTQYADVYTYEGVAFYAYYESTVNDLAPVYRFWSPSREAHFWTISEEEKDAIIRDLSDVWVYEGVVFYAYPAGRQPLGALPVYRFWSQPHGQYFYTISEQERQAVINTFPRVWSYEEIAWYAFMEPRQPRQVAYEFTGGADDLCYTLNLKAFVDGKEAVIDVPEVQLIPSSAAMEMAVDYTNLTCTFNALSVQTQTIQHAGTITAQGGTPAIPFSLSIGGTFTALMQRGPFAIDPATGIFADFADNNQSLTAQQAAYTYDGSATLGSVKTAFARSSSALLFELQSFGLLEGFSLLADGIDAQMPLTFQWRRPAVKDLLVEASVDGRLVQIYVTYAFVGTQGLWEGQAAR